MTVQETDVGISASGPTYVVVTPYAVSIYPKMLAVTNLSYKLTVPTRYLEEPAYAMLKPHMSSDDRGRD